MSRTPERRADREAAGAFPALRLVTPDEAGPPPASAPAVASAPRTLEQRVAAARAFVSGLPEDAVPAGLVLTDGTRPDRPAVRVAEPSAFMSAVLADLDGLNVARGLDVARRLHRAVVAPYGVGTGRTVAPSPVRPAFQYLREQAAREAEKQIARADAGPSHNARRGGPGTVRRRRRL